MFLKKKFFNWLFCLFIINGSVCLFLGKPIYALGADKSVAIKDNTEPDNKDKLPTTIGKLETTNIESITSESENVLPDILNKSQQKITLFININVPHNKKNVDWCRIYPYPVAPPPRKQGISELPYKDKQLRSALLAIAYWSRMRPDKTYPGGGWRMQYALKAAITKSGLGYPHTVFTEYPWVENIIPYMRKETLKINAKELERKQRYDQALDVFTQYGTELETQALNKGLFPIDVPIFRQIGGVQRGHAIVDKANWWIVAMHKVPGLKFYWLYPVKLSDNPQQSVTLNEDNAIFIEGAW